MALMPLFVAIQQFFEGLAWVSAENNLPDALYSAALAYMFFVWVFWPSWVPYMTSILEPQEKRRRLLSALSLTALFFGLFLYVPYFFHPAWLQAQILCHSIDYKTTLISDQFIPRPLTALIYLAFVGATPLLSSHRQVKNFGRSLIFFIPLTYFAYSHAYISVLCFFAAMATIQLVYIISEDKCAINTRRVPVKNSRGRFWR
ncbi:MAG: hypothetical protein DYH13_04270 [Alphaproteobacteria bacterium PRO2]|nr:hypothetical protein [Alphaproteobacteria bacterium PRO2]